VTLEEDFALGWNEGLAAAGEDTMEPSEIIKMLNLTVKGLRERCEYLQQQLGVRRDELEDARNLARLLAKEYAK
jgi:hypothetical protein